MIPYPPRPSRWMMLPDPNVRGEVRVKAGVAKTIVWVHRRVDPGLAFDGRGSLEPHSSVGSSWTVVEPTVMTVQPFAGALILGEQREHFHSFEHAPSHSRRMALKGE